MFVKDLTEKLKNADPYAIISCKIDDGENVLEGCVTEIEVTKMDERGFKFIVLKNENKKMPRE